LAVDDEPAPRVVDPVFSTNLAVVLEECWAPFLLLNPDGLVEESLLVDAIPKLAWEMKERRRRGLAYWI
jgi:hypothetical protein